MDAIRDAEVNKHIVNGLDGRYMSGEGTRMVDKWLRRSEEREEKAIQWSLEESNRRVKEERRQAKEDQSEEIEISESDSSGCDEEVEMWRRVGNRTGRRKAKVDREARTSDSGGWGQAAPNRRPPLGHVPPVHDHRHKTTRLRVGGGATRLTPSRLGCGCPTASARAWRGAGTGGRRSGTSARGRLRRGRARSASCWWRTW